MNVMQLQVSNVLRVSDLELDLEGQHLVLVGGENGEGKTSALKALSMALQGRRTMGEEWPDIPLKDGEDSGFIRVKLSGDEEMHDLEGFTAEMHFRRNRSGAIVEEFRLMDSTGCEAPSPRTLLNDLYKFRAFDPLAFDRAKPKERAEMLRSLLGLDFTELDDERAEKFSSRTAVKKLAADVQSQMSGVTYPADTPDSEVDVKIMMDALDEANLGNAQRTANIANAKAQLAENERKLQEEEANLVKIRERLELCVARIDALKEEKPDLEADVEMANQVERIDVTALRETINNASTINRNVQAKRRRAELAGQLDTHKKAIGAATARIEQIDREKAERLRSAEWPLPGLSLDAEGVLLDGLPFEQASKAQRVLASASIGMALNPKLRLMVCQDGNDLDNTSLEAIGKLAEEKDFQIILEFVTRSKDDEDRCLVVMRDGQGD